jgi:hypothetical protein
MSAEASQNGLSVLFKEYSLSNTLDYTVCWKCPDADWFALRKLVREKKTSDKQFESGSQQTVFCYSLYKNLCFKMNGTPALREKFRSYDFSAHVQGDKFVIKFRSAASKSLLKRSLKAIVAFLDPTMSSISSFYRLNAKNLGCKFDDSELAKCVNNTNQSIKNSLSVVVVGKLARFTSSDLKEFVKAVKFPDYKNKTGAKEFKSQSHGFGDHAVDYVEIKCAGGIVPYLVSEYIHFSSKHYKSQVVNKHVLVWAKSTAFLGSVHKDSVSKWLTDKYYKGLGKSKSVDDNRVKCRILSFLFDRCCDAIPCDVLSSFIKSALPSVSSLATEMMKCMK